MTQLALFPDPPAPDPGPPQVRPARPSEESLRLAARLPRALRLGTSSWSFPGWAGLVYDGTHPERTLARHGLAAYARHPLLRTVGLDRTFYRPISAADFAAYARAVPDDFRFLVKADRLLTSPTDPHARSVRTANPFFLDAARARTEVVEPAVAGLGGKLGAILFQFPPMPAAQVGGARRFTGDLLAFLDRLPPGPAYAVELRTPALLTQAYADGLRSVGAAHGYTVHPAMAPLTDQLAVARPYEQPTLVVRWMLHSGLRYEAARDRYAPFSAIVDEDPEAREAIALAALDGLLAERDVFIVVNNKAEGSAPCSVLGLARRIADGAEGV